MLIHGLSVLLSSGDTVRWCKTYERGKNVNTALTPPVFTLCLDPAQLANSAKEKGENDRSVILQQREGPRRAEAPPSLLIGSLTIKIMLLNTELFNVSFAIKLSS